MKNTILITISLSLCLSCKGPLKKENTDIKIYDNSILSIIDINSKIEILADSISLPEGPLWDEESNSLLFTDIINNKVLSWNEKDDPATSCSTALTLGFSPEANGTKLC